MTIIFLPRKKKPSQVAQVLTPRPTLSCSPGMPRYLAEAPVEIMTVSASRSPSPSTLTLKGRCEKSTESTQLLLNSAPKRSACLRILSIRSGPRMPSGKPGKFSISVVVVSCPPGCKPSITSGFKFARAK
ncbi:hypothetical protein D3C71_1709420 [compost metagenome]